MKTKANCPNCGTPLPEGAPESLCPRCLMVRGLAASTASIPDQTSEQSVTQAVPTVETEGHPPPQPALPDGDTTPDVSMGAKGQGTPGCISGRPKVRYVGDYELLQEIARGGMGVVYKGRQISLNRIVAVKMILSGQFASEKEVKRFYVEAKAAAKLQHPNIVGIHEVGQHEGFHFFSMDYVDGRSLAETVLDEGKMRPDAAAQLVKLLAGAVHYANQRGILHRDLKPQNVLIDKDGNPRITDFGLAKQVETDSSLTAPGAMMGTPAYMAPEQARGDRGQIGTHSEVYGLGAILYFCLTGLPPFQGATPFDTAQKVLHEEPVRPSKVESDVPTDLETVCLKCLGKKPESRYPTAQDLAQDLQRFLNREPVRARPTSILRRGWNWVQRHPWHLGGVGAGFMLGLVFLTYGLWQKIRRSTGLATDEPPGVLASATLFFWTIGFPFLMLGHYLVGRGFRRHMQSSRSSPRGRKWSWRGYLVLGLITCSYGFETMLAMIRLMVWQDDTATLLAALATVPWALGLLWLGAHALWETTGAHETSLFGDVVRERTAHMAQRESKQLTLWDLGIVTFWGLLGVMWAASGLSPHPWIRKASEMMGAELGQTLAWAAAAVISFLAVRALARARYVWRTALVSSVFVAAGIILSYVLDAIAKGIPLGSSEVRQGIGQGAILSATLCGLFWAWSFLLERRRTHLQVVNLILWLSIPLLLFLGTLFGFFFAFQGPFRGSILEGCLLTMVAGLGFANVTAIWRAHLRRLPYTEDALERSPLAPILAWSQLGRWRVRLLAGLASLGLIFAAFHLVENRRGERAWSQYKRELQAKGRRLECEQFIPAQIPDADNFFKAPRMAEMFEGLVAKSGPVSRPPVRANIVPILDATARRMAVLELQLWKQGDPGIPDGAIPASLVTSNPVRVCARGGVSLLGTPYGGGHFLVAPPRQGSLPRVQVVIGADQGTNQWQELLQYSGLSVEPAGASNLLRLVCLRACPVAEVLAGFKPLESDFEALFTACARPRARLSGDYRRLLLDAPFLNFVTLRTFTQDLAVRAGAHLLAGMPERALQDVRTMRRLVKVTQESNPTLISAMISVAVAGLYVETIGIGVEHRLWPETQWEALAEEMLEVEVLPALRDALACERARALSLLDSSSCLQLATVLGERPSDSAPATSVPNPDDLLVAMFNRQDRPVLTPTSAMFILAPSGWKRQNQLLVARLHEGLQESFHGPHGRLNAEKHAQAIAQIERGLRKPNPRNLIACALMPNFLKAASTAAKNQALLSQTVVALSLEHYRADTGQYPEDLDALTPKYLKTLPQEVTTSASPRYRRTPNDSYMLYSVGLDGKDDGGNAPADWVWAHAPVRPAAR